MPKKIKDKKSKQVKVVKKHYVNNDEFEDLLLRYRKTDDEKLGKQLYDVFLSIINRVYYKAISNMYSKIGGIFPPMTNHDKEDIIQKVLYFVFLAVKRKDLWNKNKRNKKNIRCKAFNYFSSIIIYEIQNAIKREFKKGWNRSDILSKNFAREFSQRTGIQVYRETYEDNQDEY